MVAAADVRRGGRRSGDSPWDSFVIYAMVTSIWLGGAAMLGVQRVRAMGGRAGRRLRGWLRGILDGRERRR